MDEHEPLVQYLNLSPFFPAIPQSSVCRYIGLEQRVRHFKTRNKSQTYLGASVYDDGGRQEARDEKLRKAAEGFMDRHVQCAGPWKPRLKSESRVTSRHFSSFFVTTTIVPNQKLLLIVHIW